MGVPKRHTFRFEGTLQSGLVPGLGSDGDETPGLSRSFASVSSLLRDYPGVCI